MGEGFGWSVAACDLDGNGRDDLIVGSPMYRYLHTNINNLSAIQEL